MGARERERLGGKREERMVQHVREPSSGEEDSVWSEESPMVVAVDDDGLLSPLSSAILLSNFFLGPSLVMPMDFRSCSVRSNSSWPETEFSVKIERSSPNSTCSSHEEHSLIDHSTGSID